MSSQQLPSTALEQREGDEGNKDTEVPICCSPVPVELLLLVTVMREGTHKAALGCQRPVWDCKQSLKRYLWPRDRQSTHRAAVGKLSYVGAKMGIFPSPQGQGLASKPALFGDKIWLCSFPGAPRIHASGVLV